MTTPNIEELIAKLSYYSGDGVQIDMARQAQRQAADALQSQAERIKVLEGQLDDATAAARSDQMIAETAQAAASRLLTERDNLRAQLNAIAATEPVASHYFDIEGNLYTANRAKFLRPSLNGLTPLFTRHMPAEIENVEPVAIALNTGTRQAVKWLQNIPHGEKLYTRPMPAQSAEHCLWARNGHEPCQHVKPMQDVSELVEVLERIEKHRTTDMYWVSGIAREALSKYKGAK